MLTARSVLIMAVAVAVLAGIGALVSLLHSPDSNGLGSDTYGTRASGFKAVFDLLAQFGVEQQRRLAPPTEMIETNTTLVIWSPEIDLVDVEPTYLHGLRQWVRSGGHIVIAPQASRDASDDYRRTQWRGIVKATSALTEIGLPGIETKTIDLTAENSDQSSTDKQSHGPTYARSKNFVQAEINDYFFPELFPITTVAVQASGDLRSMSGEVNHLVLPASFQGLDVGLERPDGSITATSSRKANDADESEPAIVVARYKIGHGVIDVVSDPAIFDNRLLAQADNAVLAVRLLDLPNQKLAWDEFYHGLTVRGNPLYLLTRGSYALIAALAIVLVGLWVWRQAVFIGPPLPTEQVSRRTVAEYIGAMSTFLGAVPEVCDSCSLNCAMACYGRCAASWDFFASRTQGKTSPPRWRGAIRRPPASS